MANADDVLIGGDKYSWTSASEMPLQTFLAKYKPSMVENDGTKPWIWVQGSDATNEDTNRVETRAQEEAAVLLEEVTERVKAIQEDPSIPTRSNKKTGARSKKELREEVQAGATNKLKEIAIRHGYVSGKWLIFAPSDKVDLIWSHIANSLVSGPLSSTAAWLAKVATSPEHETLNYQHLICVYIPDVYDKRAVIEVMKVLLRDHGVTLSGVKSDLYTMIGIDSKHPSGIPSTIWKNTALLQDAEIKALKGEFFANLGMSKIDTANKGANVKEVAPSEQSTKAESSSLEFQSKSKPKLKRKVRDDPFTSDSEAQDEEEKKRKDMLKPKKMVMRTKRTEPEDEDDNGNTEEKPEPKRRRTRK